MGAGGVRVRGCGVQSFTLRTYLFIWLCQVLAAAREILEASVVIVHRFS